MHQLVDQYNITYHHCINKKSISADYPALPEKIETKPKAQTKLKVIDRVRIIKHKNIFSRDYIENWSREIFIIDSFLKITLGLKKLKI